MDVARDFPTNAVNWWFVSAESDTVIFYLLNPTLFAAMFDRENSGTVDIHAFAKLFEYVNQWLNVFKTYDRNGSGQIDDQELNQGKQQLCDISEPILLYFISSILSNGFQLFTAIHKAIGEQKQRSQRSFCWRIYRSVCFDSTFDRGISSSWYTTQRNNFHWFRRFSQCCFDKHKLKKKLFPWETIPIWYSRCTFQYDSVWIFLLSKSKMRNNLVQCTAKRNKNAHFKSYMFCSIYFFHFNFFIYWFLLWNFGATIISIDYLSISSSFFPILSLTIYSRICIIQFVLFALNWSLLFLM